MSLLVRRSHVKELGEKCEGRRPAEVRPGRLVPDNAAVRDSYGPDGSRAGIFGRRFSAGGLPQGDEFQVNSYTTQDQRYPAVALDATGNFVVVWQGEYQDGSSYGVFGQRYGDIIFRDGFE